MAVEVDSPDPCIIDCTSILIKNWLCINKTNIAKGVWLNFCSQWQLDRTSPQLLGGGRRDWKSFKGFLNHYCRSYCYSYQNEAECNPRTLLEQSKGSITVLLNIFAGPLLAHESVLEYLDIFKSRKSKTESLKSVPAEDVYLLMLWEPGGLLSDILKLDLQIFSFCW